ncbi:MAG: tetratricopeptide repeat protein [Burkholderiales bacterium]|jgi:predicted negative regulator of RcsB-dependent stress response|nr:tetratricopeptide repeat protein [Burkholderiales bacterium]
MATHLDLEEQEQLDELKHFWKRWGNLITWLVIGILSSYAGWMGWQAWASKQSAQSAALFDTVERAAVSGDLALFERSVGDIKSKFGSTTYAHQAAFLASRIFQEKSRPKEAKEQLQWVIDQASDEGYQALARLRLSSLLIEDKEFDAARKLLTAKTPSAFEPLTADRLGDLEMLTNQPAQAIKQYQLAWKAMEPNAQYRRLIAFKLAALGADPEASNNAPASKPTQDASQ